MVKKKRFEINTTKRSAGFSMKSPHSHSWYELFYLISGECILNVDGNLWRLGAGSIAIFPPDVLHSTAYTGTNSAQRMCIEFSQNYIEPLLESTDMQKLFEPLIHTPVSLSLNSSVSFNRTVSDILEEQQNDDTFSDLLKTCQLNRLLIYLIRDFHSIPAMPPKKFHDNTIHLALFYIERNFHNHITLDSLASIYHLNPSYFSKKFKTACGMGFKEYLTNFRIVHSEKLLLETQKSITEIAFECGFESSNYYGDAFRRKNGVSPSRFRQLKGNS